MAAGLRTATSPSRFRPIGPTAIVKLPPRVRLPPFEKASTAACVLRMMTKSVTWLKGSKNDNNNDYDNDGDITDKMDII